jgi:hypothetical protein
VILYSLSDYAGAGAISGGGKGAAKTGKKLRIGMFMARGE